MPDPQHSPAFVDLTIQLAAFLSAPSGAFSLSLEQVDKSTDGTGLKEVVSRQPLKTLLLGSANIATPDQLVAALAGGGADGSGTAAPPDANVDDKWGIIGSPTTAWPVAGFDRLTIDIKSATALLLVTDAADKPTVELRLSSGSPIGAVSVVMDKIDGTTTIGTPDQPIPLESVLTSLGDALPSSWSALRALLPDGLDFGLISAAITAQYSPDDPTKMTGRGGRIVGTVTVGALTLEVTIDLKPGEEAKPDITLTWPAETAKDQAASLNDLLAGMHMPFSLPGPLDRPLRGFEIAYEAVELPDQLNPNDTRRLVLAMPPDQLEPDLRMCWSLDASKGKRLVTRANWDEVELPSPPLVGDAIRMLLRPLDLVLTGDPMTVFEAATLAAIEQLPEMMHVEAGGHGSAGADDDSKDHGDGKKTAFVPGIYLVGWMQCDIPDQPLPPDNSVSLRAHPFNIPLYTSDAKLPPPKPGTKPEPPPEAAKTTHTDVQKTIGPVQIGGVGFRFENGSIALLLDVTMVSGGLRFELVNLSAGIRLADRALSTGLDGFVLSYESGEVSITGGFERDTSGSSGTDYVGTVLLRVGEAITIEIAGGYSGGGGEPPKIFLFGAVKRALGGPPWMFIQGLAAGFGYNRALKPPAVESVNDFPFVKIANDVARGDGDGTERPNANDAQKVWGTLQAAQYLAPSVGSDFVAAGFMGTSFGFVDTTVIAVIAFGASTEVILLGSASAALPKGMPIARADIEVIASVQQDAGLIAIDGLLAPGSYVLSTDCHLTGGFASHSWFAGPHKDDFVLTFGGYRPGYRAPAHYPVVPRLGYVWKVGDEVLITGWSYFALTPSLLQAGGGLSIVFNAGPLSAWCNATADLTADWHPFHYDVGLHVDFGVSLTVDCFFCSVTLSADITADLAIWGPALTGHADVSLWFVSFGVDFGADASRDKPSEDWSKSTFLTDLVVPQPPATQALRASRPAAVRAATLLRDDPAPATTTVQPVEISGLDGVSTDGAPAGVDWIADPKTTVIQVTTKLPSATATLNDADVDGVPAISLQARAIAGAPTINPKLTITVTSTDAVDAWHASPIMSSVPSGVWKTTGASGGETAPETVPALGGVSLDIVPKRPDATVPIEQNVLLFDDLGDIPLAWQKPATPAAGGFTWDHDGPFKTIKSAAAARASLLGAMVSAGYLDQPSVDAIDVDLIVATQPCFMAGPMLCRLGADQLS